MSNAVLSLLVLIPSGFLMGVVLFVVGVLQGPKRSDLSTGDPSHTRGRQEGRLEREGFMAKLIRKSKQEADRGVVEFKSAPRSWKLAIAVFYGLIAVIAAGVVLSPVTMRWWPFLAAAFIGFWAAQLIHRTAKLGTMKREEPGA